MDLQDFLCLILHKKMAGDFNSDHHVGRVNYYLNTQKDFLASSKSLLHMGNLMVKHIKPSLLANFFSNSACLAFSTNFTPLINSYSMQMSKQMSSPSKYSSLRGTCATILSERDDLRLKTILNKIGHE